MVKNCAYIKRFTPEQKKLLEKLSSELKIKNASDIFLHCLASYPELKSENERLKRFNERKQKKIETLTNAQCPPTTLTEI
jgi:hypothetical protein